MTLVEVVAVFALIALLAGLVMPFVGPRSENARKQRAEVEVETIAQGIRDFWRMTGVWPCRDRSGNADGLHVLCSGVSLPTSNPWTSSSDWWARFQAGDADLLANHLLENRPGGSSANAYPVRGTKAWRGPYADAVPLDPWGRPYVVLIAAGRASPSSSDPVQLFVLSAGPDGALSTGVAGGASASIEGDDIGLVAWRRA